MKEMSLKRTLLMQPHILCTLHGVNQQEAPIGIVRNSTNEVNSRYQRENISQTQLTR